MTTENTASPEAVAPMDLLQLKNAALSLQVAQLEYRIAVDKTLQPYRIVDGDSVDMTTGAIARAARVASASVDGNAG